MKGRPLSYYLIVILILAILPAPAVVDIVVDVVTGPNSGLNLGEDETEVTVVMVEPSVESDSEIIGKRSFIRPLYRQV